MNYWIEKTYPSKRAEGDFTSLLLSPKRNQGGADIYSNMRKVKRGDIVFHINQDINILVGYSIASDAYDQIIIKEEELYSINLTDFHQLEKPINIDSFLSNKDNHVLLSKIKSESEVFYQTRAEKYYIKQGGYLTKLDERIVQLFMLNVPVVSIEENFEWDESKTFFKEGKIKYKLHKHKERNKKLIKAAKKAFKLKYKGKIFCEACSFDFTEVYGKEIGEDYIEGHHIIPLSELKEDHESTINDIVLLCANCHRMIHRKRPWLSMDRLTSLLSSK